MEVVSERIYQIVAGIPKGKVMSYGQIGVMVGIGPRQVGMILHENPDNSVVPCHRVVRADGSIASGYAFGGAGEQRKILEKEGVKFKNGKVVRFCLIRPIGQIRRNGLPRLVPWAYTGSSTRNDVEINASGIALRGYSGQSLTFG